MKSWSQVSRGCSAQKNSGSNPGRTSRRGLRRAGLRNLISRGVFRVSVAMGRTGGQCSNQFSHLRPAVPNAARSLLRFAFRECFHVQKPFCDCVTLVSAPKWPRGSIQAARRPSRGRRCVGSGDPSRALGDDLGQSCGCQFIRMTELVRQAWSLISVYAAK